MEEKNYKKLYEDVVALAKDGLKDGLYLSRSAKDVTEFLFPQLKETEDEKVRRELTRFLITFNNGYYSKPSETEIDSWIKWIDKKSIVNTTTKFKVGDWVTDGNNVLKIKCLGNEFYCYENVNGYVDDMLISELDSKYHIWTIKDAKKGNILTVVNDERPFIFNGLLDSLHPRNPVAYCGIAKRYGFIISNTNAWWTDEEVEPATKRISDSLFQRIHEEGYEWDAEKKELRKIEQKSTEWSEHQHKLLNYAISMTDDTEVKAFLESLRNTTNNKQEWSEEDEKMKSLIISTLTSMGTINLERYHHMNLDKVENWLKSIKPHWKPSDEQIEILDMVLTNESMDDNVARILRELKEQIEKL